MSGYKGSTFNTHQAAIRFFFAVTLNRGMNYLQIPRMKNEKKLPEILSREEIALLLEQCGNIKHKAIFALAYGSGLRRSEICRLKVQDIDSKHMRVFVRDGKGVNTGAGATVARDFSHTLPGKKPHLAGTEP